VKSTLVNVTLLFGFVMSIVSVVVTFKGIVAAPNDFAMTGASACADKVPEAASNMTQIASDAASRRANTPNLKVIVVPPPLF
jgi:hypothetical protein